MKDAYPAERYRSQIGCLAETIGLWPSGRRVLGKAGIVGESSITMVSLSRVGNLPEMVDNVFRASSSIVN